MTPRRTPLRLTIYAWVLTALFIVVSGSLGFDSGQFLRKLFFAVRGVRRDLPPVHLVVLQDLDFDPPLSLSTKYHISDSEFEDLLSRIRAGGVRNIFIDQVVLAQDKSGVLAKLKGPPSENPTESQKLYSSNISTYSTLVSNVSVPVWRAALIPFSSMSEAVVGVSDVSPDYAQSAPLPLENGVLSVLPERSAIYRSTLTIADSSSPRYIDFYGPAGTLPRSSFSRVLTATTPELFSLFNGKDVFIGRESILFLKGQIPSHRYAAAIGGEEFIDTELQATMRANLLDESYLVAGSRNFLFIALFVETVLGIVFARTPYRYASIGLLVVLVSSILALYQLFLKSLWFIGSELLPIYPLILLVAVSATTIRRSWEEERETRSYFYLD